MQLPAKILRLLITEVLRHNTIGRLHLPTTVEVLILHQQREVLPLPTVRQAATLAAVERQQDLHLVEVQEEGINSLFFFTFLFYSPFNNYLYQLSFGTELVFSQKEQKTAMELRESEKVFQIKTGLQADTLRRRSEV